MPELENQSATYQVNDELRIDVLILKTRQAYGRTDALITPCQGTGEQWVNLKNLEVKEGS